MNRDQVIGDAPIALVRDLAQEALEEHAGVVQREGRRVDLRSFALGYFQVAAHVRPAIRPYKPQFIRLALGR